MLTQEQMSPLGPLGISKTELISADLGDSRFRVRLVHGTETLGRLFEYRTQLLSELPLEELEAFVGFNITLRIPLSNGDERFLNGIVREIKDAGATRRFHRYDLVVVPWLWFLTQNTDCRIFEDLSVPEIVVEALRSRGFSDVTLALGEDHPKREYCVQYRESDASFVSRLLEEEGIYYFFRHEPGKHVLVLADGPASHDPSEQFPILRHVPRESAAQEEEVVCELSGESRVCRDRVVRTNYDFTKPRVDLQVRRLDKGPNLGLESFDYPSRHLDFLEGERYTRIQLEEMRVGRTTLSGLTPARGVHPGELIDIVDAPSARFEGASLVVETSIEATCGTPETGDPEGFSFRCRLKTIPASRPFRLAPITPRPVIAGPQTAVVVSPSNIDGEIWTDKYGRIRVQFHWDRQKSISCWVRVAQFWAGREWGSLFIPRVGHEVVVQFLEGNPDHPLVVGSVHNAISRPPQELPEKASRSGIRSRSLDNSGGFNELTFDDASGQEEIFVHAERNLRTVVKAFEQRSVGGSRKTTIGKDDSLTVRRDQVVNVEEGDRTINVRKGDHTINVAAGMQTTNVAEGDCTVNVRAGNHTINVGTHDLVESIHGNRRTDVITGDSSEVVHQGRYFHEVRTGDREVHVLAGNSIERLTAGDHHTVLTAGSDLLTVVAGSRVVSALVGVYQVDARQIDLTALDQITLRCGEASISLTKDGTITIEGAAINLKENALSLSSCTINGDGIQSKALNIMTEATGKHTLKGTRIDLNP